jgi:hypothetical protein
MLSKERLDSLWQSGFCKTLIERVRYTEEGPGGSSVRVQLTDDHIKSGCNDCTNANAMRDVEMRVATVMGPEAVNLFNNGGNLRTLPGFDHAFRQTFSTGVRCGRVKPQLVGWISKMVMSRAGRPYPYTEDKDAPKAN